MRTLWASSVAVISFQGIVLFLNFLKVGGYRPWGLSRATTSLFTSGRAADPGESAHMRLTQKYDVEIPQEVESKAVKAVEGVPFVEFVDKAEATTLAALSGDDNTTRLELFGYHLHKRNLSESASVIIRHERLNMTDPQTKERLTRLWRAERLITPGRDPFDGASQIRKGFETSLLEYARRVEMIHTDCTKNDAELTDFMDANKRGWKERYSYVPDRPRGETVALLKELMVWFREEFPYYYGGCQVCTESTNEFLGHICPSPDERAADGLAARTELYVCGKNRTHISRFPRFNAVNRVLSTRRGRCGEYSVLSLRVLQLLGHEMRWVVDWSDHVWCEVVSPNGQPAIHVDPCEAVVDEPLIYQGWGKNQTFIVAFPISNNDSVVEDVTSSYTSDFESSLARRLELEEPPEAIHEALTRLNARLSIGDHRD